MEHPSFYQLIVTDDGAGGVQANGRGAAEGMGLGSMRERVEAIVGDAARGMWISTFHSACVRILRREITRVGYESNFTIYDTDDSLRLIKEPARPCGSMRRTSPPQSAHPDQPGQG